jgi:integrase
MGVYRRHKEYRQGKYRHCARLCGARVYEGDTVKLTDTFLKSIKNTVKTQKFSDGHNLYLLATPSGGRLWRVDYRLAGKRKTLALGAYPAVSLKEARNRRDKAKEQLAAGIDPGVAKAEAKAEAMAEARDKALTFENVAMEWFSKKTGHLTPRYRKQLKSRLENMIFPHIGGKPFSKLEPADIIAVARYAENRGCLEMAHRLLQVMGQITRYARICGYVKYDVGGGLSEALAVPKVKHHAAITDPAEIGDLLRGIDSYSVGDLSIRGALQIMPYVFVRSGELRAAEWSEFDLGRAEWVIPAGRMKMRRAHIVPLARQVVRLLEGLNDFTGGGQYVFPSTFSTSRYISDMGLLNALRRLGYAKGEMTIHGFRGMASTILNEQGYRPDVIEAQLAHGERDAIRGAYNRAEYLPERRKMMQEWADYLDGLRNSKS